MRWIPSPAANRKELYGITHGYIKRRIPTTLMDRKSILTALAFLLFSLGSLWGQTPASQGDKTVRGRITDEAGEPLIGAAVVNKTNGKGVEAGADGTYSIVIRGRTLLEFAFIGMETVQATFDGAKDAVFNVRMKSSNALNEAVVSAGYGVIQKRENFAGSAFEIKGEDLKVRAHDRLDNMLAGMVPGMQVTESSVNGARTSISIRIRGDGSLSASNEPLWVIDGVPVYTGTKSGQVTGSYSTVSPLSYINPDDIENITILKDATTTTLYGADGANGVILVTTRNANAGKNKFQASIQYGIDNVDPSTRIKYLNSSQWFDIAHTAWTNSGRDLKNFPWQDNEYQTFTNVDTDWFDIYTGTGSTIEANFSVTGGTEKLKHFLSAGAYLLESPYLGNNQNRFNLREKTTIEVTKNLSAELHFSGGFQHNNVFSISGFGNYMPIYSPWNEDGSYRLYNYYSTSDEYKVVKRRFTYNKLPEREYNEDYQNATLMEGALTLIYKTPLEGVTLTSQSTANFQSIYESRYESRMTLSGMNTDDSSLSGYSGRYGVFDLRFKEDLRVNYDRIFISAHKISAVAGVEFIDTSHPYLQATGNGFSNDFIREISYANQDTRKGTSNISHSRSMSYLANFNYTYDNRYTLTLTGRRQGNSAFSEYSQWQAYGAAALRWNLHREKFFQVPWISQLSLRVSYGANGNSRVDSSSSYGSYSLSGTYGANMAATLSSPANPGLSWEKTYIFNPGINLGLWKGRIGLDIDYYNRSTHDVIYDGRVSSVITSGGVKHNVGIIENQGWEFVLNTTNIEHDNFTWRTYINGARNRNIIKKLDGDSYTGFFDHIWIEGQQKDAMWLIDFAGVDPVSGRRMYYDKNGDLTYTANFADRVYMPQYTSQPTLYGGVSNSFTIMKRWNAQFMFDYTLGGWQYYTLIYDAGSIDRNLPVEILDHWTTPGEGAGVPRIEYNNANTLADYNSPYDLWNKTSLQLRSLSIGYALPSEWAKAMHLSSCSVSFIGRNLYFWSIGQSAKRNSYKTIRDPYGVPRTFSIAVNLSF